MRGDHAGPAHWKTVSELLDRTRGDVGALAVMAGLSFYDETGLGLQSMMAESWENLCAKALAFLQTDKPYRGGFAWLYAPIWIRRPITDYELSKIRIWPFPDLASYVVWTESSAPSEEAGKEVPQESRAGDAGLADHETVAKAMRQLQSMLNRGAEIEGTSEPLKNPPPPGNSTT
jgi:hypothetical protein